MKSLKKHIETALALSKWKIKSDERGIHQRATLRHFLGL
jgi:hypothetical protein